ncbi:MAG TPA: hypothetical protein VFY13_00025 [Luteolibacter sp.]|nr:hypothetical protein [Luteolibacter sp.]
MKPAFVAVCLTLVLAVLAPLQAQPRIWKNKNATRSFNGEFVSRTPEEITIRRVPSREVVVLKTEQFHADDLKWLREHHPLDSEKPALSFKAAPGKVYDELAFGDTRQDVMAKLRKSKVVEATIAEALMGRTGLNGVYRTRKGNDFLGMPANLHFSWDDSDRLKEIDFYSQPVPVAKTKDVLMPQWSTLLAGLKKTYGPGKAAEGSPDPARQENGSIMFTHAWALPSGGGLLLGTGKNEDGDVIVVVRLASQAP